MKSFNIKYYGPTSFSAKNAKKTHFHWNKYLWQNIATFRLEEQIRPRSRCVFITSVNLDCVMYTSHAYISRLQSLNHIGEDAEIYQITEISNIAKQPFETASHVE